MLAREVMTAPVLTVGPHTGVPEIAKLLLEQRISAVPVEAARVAAENVAGIREVEDNVRVQPEIVVALLGAE